MNIKYSNNILLNKEVLCEVRGNGNTGWNITLGDEKEVEVKMCVIGSEEFESGANDLYLSVDTKVVDDMVPNVKWYPIAKNISNSKAYYDRLCFICDEFIRIISKLRIASETTDDTLLTISNGIPTYDMLSKMPIKFSLMEDKSIKEHIESEFKFVQEEIDRAKKTLDIVLTRNCMYA